jgi:rod shape-determining protein MreC
MIMAKRQGKIPERFLFTSLLLAGLIVLFAPQRLTNKFQFMFVRIFCWPLSVSGDISLSASGLMASAQGSPAEVVSRQRYDKLHNRLANVTEWLRQERVKVKKLSGLRDRPVWKGVSFVLADVIVATVDGAHGELIIDRGQEDGLAVGQFVLSGESVVGTVSAIDSRTARVRLISDPASKIAARIEGLNIDAICQGAGGSVAKVPLVPTRHRIETGALVCAQKKPGFLGVPVIIGTVSECEKNPENPLLWDITVKPACDINKLTDVAAVVMNPRK